MGRTPLGVFIFYSLKNKERKFPFTNSYILGICSWMEFPSVSAKKKTGNVHFDLNSVFSLSYKISFADTRSLLMEYITYITRTSVRNFSRNFLTFFQKLPSAYIFINCTNLWKFVIIVFNTYLNFIILSKTFTIFWKAIIKFE